MHRVLQHKLLSSTHTVHRPCTRLISGRRHPARVRNFHRSSSRYLPKGPQNSENPVEGGGEPEPSNEETRSAAPIAGNGQSETALAKIQPKSLTYYGSAARRHLRRNNAKESEHPAISPKWFRDANVHFFDELKPATASPIQLVLPTPWKGYVGLPRGETNRAETTASEEGEVEVLKANSGLYDGLFADKLAREPVPLPGKRYFVDLPSFTEIYYTAKGLLKLPHPSFAGEVAAEKSHLVLHYPVEGGSFLLDETVEKLSHRMRCDLVVLDAQDISELVASSPDLDSPPEEFMHASRLLSYEVYSNKDQRFPADEYGADEDEDPFELESSGDTNRPKGFRMGRPMIIAKTMNLADLFGSAAGGSSPRGRSRTSRSFLGGMSGEVTHRPKSPKHILAPVIDGLLAAPQLMRVLKEASNTTPKPPEKAAATTNSTPARIITSQREGLIIHVKDLRSIQETEFGGQFLSALYEIVQQRRMSGEPIIVIGTEASSNEAGTYSKSQILEMQRGDQHEISRSIFLSPVTPNTDAKLALSEDKRRRTRIINMRHLFEQYRHRDVGALLQLPDSFWTLDPAEYLGKLDWSLFETSHLSFGEIHRLSALLAGMSGEEPFGPGHLQRALRHLAASDQIKYDWAEQGRSKDRPVADDKTSMLRKTATKHEKRLLGGLIESDKIKTTFNDVHAPTETIEALKTLTTLSLIRPEAFLYGVLATDKIPGLLLYGPPGTGKTLLAKAVAKESGAAMLEVSAAEINDMYVGEGEKNVKALFSLAKKLAPCVIFIDEADALFSSRTSGHQRVSHRELLNQFLKEWDGMSNDSAGAFIMVATNRPGDLDEAVLRRLPRRLLVDLPTENDRLEILKIHLRDEQLAADVDLADLAKKTPFYSGSDLKNLCVAAALTCVREESELAKAHRGEQPYQHAEKRTLTGMHFSKALEEITASISEDMNSLKDIKKFDEQYGDKRGKKKVSRWGFKAANDADKVLDTVKVRT